MSFLKSWVTIVFDVTNFVDGMASEEIFCNTCTGTVYIINQHTHHEQKIKDMYCSNGPVKSTGTRRQPDSLKKPANAQKLEND